MIRSKQWRRVLWAGLLAATLPGGVLAQENASPDRVVLFKSGVAYFEHEREVEGPGSIRFPFREEQMQDVLKSLVVGDSRPDALRGAFFESREPLERRLKTFQVDLTGSPDLAELLTQLRGEGVTVDLASGPMDGWILGVEERTRGTESGEIQEHYLNLVLEAGVLKQVPLAEVEQMAWRDPALQTEWGRALSALAEGRRRDRKTLSLEFADAPPRTVRVGYLLEAPVWKSSYRLVLGESPPVMQAWAHIENTTEEDWADVALELVSGRPVSFVMNLYDPLYLQRPEIALDTQAMQPVGAPNAMPRMAARMADAALPMAFESKAGGGVPAAEMIGAAPEVGLEGTQVGELFSFRAPVPVSLGRRESAMIPLFQRAVEAESISLYDPRSNADRPFNAVVVSNTTEAPWMNGPVTVYESGVYAGDARLPVTSPGAERTLSYALDLHVAADRTVMPPSERIVRATIRRGVLEVERKNERRTHYAFTSERADDRALRLVHPRMRGWSLTSPETTRQTEEVAEFRRSLKPGGKLELTVVETRLLDREIRIASLGLDALLVYRRNEALDPAVRAALGSIAASRQDIVEQERSVQRLDEKLKGLIADQDRIRKNMQAVSQGAPSYKTWERKLMQQEEEVDAQRAALAQARQHLDDLQTSFENEILMLNVGGTSDSP